MIKWNSEWKSKLWATNNFFPPTNQIIVKKWTTTILSTLEMAKSRSKLLVAKKFIKEMKWLFCFILTGNLLLSYPQLKDNLSLLKSKSARERSDIFVCYFPNKFLATSWIILSYKTRTGLLLHSCQTLLKITMNYWCLW